MAWRSRPTRCWLLVAATTSTVCTVLALENGRLRAPALGFSDACLGGGESTRLGAAQLQAVATGFIESGLAQLGYTHMNLDDSWELMNRSASGALVPDPAKFPGGVRALRDWLHDRNLTLGLYTSDAERSCKPTAGSLYHESQDARTLALEFGVDFIKVDNCGEVNLNSFAKFSALRDAFNRTGASVAFSCEPHVTSAIGWLPFVCNQWRTTSDNCKLASDYSGLPTVLAANNVMAHNARPGAWNDLDPVMIGAGIEGQISVPEARSMFTLYAAVKAPLLLGSDPTRMGDDYLPIVKNAEMIAVNQDSEGVPAVAVWASTATVDLRADDKCPVKPPPQHKCCDHPYCRKRNETECHSELNCCYHGTGAAGQCWLNEPGPSPGPNPTPSPPPLQPTPDEDGLLAFCEWGDREVASAQRWSIGGDGRVRSANHSLCLERVTVPATEGTSAITVLGLKPCASRARQLFETNRVNETLAQIRVPTSDNLDADHATRSRASTSCVGTDGKRVLLVPCATEDPSCELKRCAHSVLSNQLWYLSSTTGQLMSSFTASAIPPLDFADVDKISGSSAGWGPNNGTLVNIPLCLASAPNSRPARIPQPPSVLPDGPPWPAQQVWAGPLSGGAFVVVLWNLDIQPANMEATFADIGVAAGSTCSVRDLWQHTWLANATGRVRATVPSHDVVALKLAPL